MYIPLQLNQNQCLCPDCHSTKLQSISQVISGFLSIFLVGHKQNDNMLYENTKCEDCSSFSF